MSQETVPEQGADVCPPAKAPKGLLQQMEELLASVSADLADLASGVREGEPGDAPRGRD